MRTQNTAAADSHKRGTASSMSQCFGVVTQKPNSKLRFAPHLPSRTPVRIVDNLEQVEGKLSA